MRVALDRGMVHVFLLRSGWECLLHIITNTDDFQQLGHGLNPTIRHMLEGGVAPATRHAVLLGCRANVQMDAQ